VAWNRAIPCVQPGGKLLLIRFLGVRTPNQSMAAHTLAGPRTPGVRAQRGGVPTATLFAFVCYAILPVLQTRNSASTPGVPRSADAFGMLASLASVNCKHYMLFKFPTARFHASRVSKYHTECFHAPVLTPGHWWHRWPHAD